MRTFNRRIANTFAVSAHHNSLTIVDIDFIRPDKWVGRRKEEHPFYKFISSGIAESTFAVKTPSGGLHLYFKFVPELRKQANSGKWEIDLRVPYTRNGYVLAPSSVVR